MFNWQYVYSLNYSTKRKFIKSLGRTATLSDTIKREKKTLKNQNTDMEYETIKKKIRFRRRRRWIRHKFHTKSFHFNDPLSVDDIDDSNGETIILANGETSLSGL